MVNYTKNIIFQVLKVWFIIDPIKKLLVKKMYLPYSRMHLNLCLLALLRVLTMLKSLVSPPTDKCKVITFQTIEVYQWKSAV